MYIFAFISIIFLNHRYKDNYYKYNAIKDIWNLRKNIPVKINYQVKTDLNNKLDMSKEKLFFKVNNEILNKYTDFIKLIDNYNIYLKEKEFYSKQELNEINLFLNNVLNSDPGKYLIEVIKFKKKHLNNKDKIKKYLFEIWFELYDRKSNGVKDSCGFEHVFLGELYSKNKPGKLGGYHNWIKYYLDELKNNSNYYGYLINKDPDVLTIQLSHMGIFKKIGGFFLGIDPYTEFCIYSVAFISKGKYSILNLNNKKIKIITYPYYNKYISTAFPKILNN